MRHVICKIIYPLYMYIYISLMPFFVANRQMYKKFDGKMLGTQSKNKVMWRKFWVLMKTRIFWPQLSQKHGIVFRICFLALPGNKSEFTSDYHYNWLLLFLYYVSMKKHAFATYSLSLWLYIMVNFLNTQGIVSKDCSFASQLSRPD